MTAQMIDSLPRRCGVVNILPYERRMTTGAQMRAARALVRWTVEDLAREANVGVMTVRRAEANDGPVKMLPNNLAAIRAALEAAGVIFVEENGEGPGVRLRKSGKAEQ
jgi:transcriptional regulator with XRE-family HTH domain